MDAGVRKIKRESHQLAEYVVLKYNQILKTDMKRNV